MALKKYFKHPVKNFAGEYVSIISLRWEKGIREASAVLGLFENASHAKTPNAEPCGMFGKVRIAGDVFEQYRQASLTDGSNQEQQLYIAAKAGHLISDFGAQSLSDAEDV